MSKYTDSKQERIRKVINDNDMGDRKPSTFLQELKLKASGDFTEERLKNIWLQRLPVNVQSVLATKNDIELDTLAQMADRIHEVTTTTNINAISTKNSQAQRTSEEIEHLLSSVEVLKTKIEQISTHNYGKNRETQNDYRNPNKTPPRPRQGEGNQPYYCWYHQQFGNKARRCTKPCSYRSERQVRQPTIEACAGCGNKCQRLFINDRKTGLRFLVDSGADISVIPTTKKTKPTSLTLYAANGSTIKTFGTKNLTLDLGIRKEI